MSANESAASLFPGQLLAEVCRRHGVRRLSLFGSRLTGAPRPDSDIDLLVEFHPGHRIGLIGMAGLERKLSELFGGCNVDLRTPAELSPHFRDEVVRSATVWFTEK